MNRHLIDEITRIATTGSADEVRFLQSPVDGSALVVTFHGGKKLALSIVSSKGDFRLSLDGIVQEPPWVKEVGLKIETEARR